MLHKLYLFNYINNLDITIIDEYLQIIFIFFSKIFESQDIN
jgi:hypothetical protein